MKKNKIVLPILLVVSSLFVACSPKEPGNTTAEPQVLQSKTEKMVDLTKMTPTAVFQDVALERNTEMRGIGVTEDEQTFYISQAYGKLPSDLMITKVEKKEDSWEKTEWMHASESGYGSLSVENSGDGKTSLWLESNGTLDDMGTTISCVEWQNEGFLQREYGKTISFDDLDGYFTLQVDAENDWVVLRVISSEGEPRYEFYDRSSLLDEEEPECLYRVTCSGGQKALRKDDSKGRYGTVTFRGFTVGDGYIYQVHGSAQGRIYIAAFDMEGQLVYCKEMKEYTELTYRQPEALSYVNGKLYMLLTTGEKDDRLATVLTFE